LVCDPNFPGSERAINFSFGTLGSDMSIRGVSFDKYASGSDAASAARGDTLYDKFGFIGTTALIDYDFVKAIWLDLMNNNGKQYMNVYFPLDIPFRVSLGKDTGGQLKTAALIDDLVLSKDDLIQSNPEGKFMFTPQVSDKLTRLTIYNGTVKLNAFVNMGLDIQRWMTLDLSPGNNDIGILYEHQDKDGNYKFANFYRFNIMLADGVTGAPATGAFSKDGPWKLSYEYIEECVHTNESDIQEHGLPHGQDSLGTKYAADPAYIEYLFTAGGKPAEPGDETNFRLLGNTNTAYSGTISEDGKSISGNLVLTFSGKHWVKGIFIINRK
jgi:hypothetical protein